MRHLTSLEEDMRAIGLLPAKKLAESAPAAAAPAAAPVAPAAELDEVRRIKTKRHTAGEKRKWRMAARHRKVKAKAYRRKGSTKRKHKLIMKKRAKLGLNNKPHAKHVRIQVMGMDRVSKLVEDVADIVGAIEASKKGEIVKGFANLALAADQLSKNMKAAANDLGEGVLLDLSTDYADLAEEAAEVATALNGGDSYETSDLEEMFRDAMDDLLEGMEIYDELLDEQCDDDDEEEPDADDEEPTKEPTKEGKY